MSGKGPLTWVETRGIEPRTSCLQIADHHSCGVSTVLGPRSPSGLTHPAMGPVTGTAMAREKRIPPRRRPLSCKSVAGFPGSRRLTSRLTVGSQRHSS